jgi:hypothetical protein
MIASDLKCLLLAPSDGLPRVTNSSIRGTGHAANSSGASNLGQTLYRIHGTNQPSTIGTFVSLAVSGLPMKQARAREVLRLAQRRAEGTLQSVAAAPSMIPAGPASRHLHTAAI